MILVTHDQEEAMSISDKIASAFVLDFIGNPNIIKSENGTNIFIRPECIKITKIRGIYLVK